MYSHAPANYECPFCRIAEEHWGLDLITDRSQIVFRTETVTAFIGSHWWPNNPGSAIVIPNDHYENIYELPAETASHVHEAARRLAMAMKEAYGCEGTSTRQHNEPSGNQEIWHYHLHVFPRWSGDRLYELSGERRVASPSERTSHAARLRDALGPLPPTPWPPRRVVLIGAVVMRDSKVLFVRQAEGHPFEGKWTIPWGVLDPGYTLEEACVTEVREEAGVKAEVEGLLGVHHTRRPEGSISLIFRCRHIEGEPRPDGVETDRAEYLSADDIRRMGDEILFLTSWTALRVLSGEDNVLLPRTDTPNELLGFA